MSVTFKKILRKSPFDKEGTGKYYPQLITWGKPATLNTIAKQMKEKSSLTLGDIKSVLTNFVEVTRSELYNGHAVNIENLACPLPQWVLIRRRLVCRRPSAGFASISVHPPVYVPILPPPVRKTVWIL